MKRIWLSRLAAGGAAVAAITTAVYVFAVRPWHLRWGATDEEVRMRLPGDELVPNPRINATHAITIRASAANVWPWLAQIGQGRGGFYSYDWIENVMGLNIHSADRIIPEFQHLEVGSTIPLAPGGFDIPVAAVEPGRVLVLHGDTRSGNAPVALQMKPGEYMNTSWTFYLDGRADGTTRLIERFRADYNPSPQNTLFYRVFLEPGAFLMERKMLLGIKERAERE